MIPHWNAIAAGVMVRSLPAFKHDGIEQPTGLELMTISKTEPFCLLVPDDQVGTAQAD